MPSVLSSEQRAIIDEEERLLVAARAAIDGAAPNPLERNVRAKMSSLRAELGTASNDDLAMIAAEAQRVRSTAAIQARAERPDRDQPYFAHMQLESDRGVRDVLLGQCTFIDSARRVSIVDWRAAPVAQVFFHYQEGEEYEQEFPDRWVEGVLRKRRVLAFHHGQLVQIQTPETSLRRNAAGEWAEDATLAPPKLEGGDGGALAERVIGTGLSGLKLPVISSLLDETQYQALTLDTERPLLVLGGAGCGKTTVALHRLAYLAYQRSDLYVPSRLIVIVPEEGLVRLTRILLAELGMDAVAVMTVDDWFTSLGSHAFPELPAKLSVSTPAAVLRLKRHPALHSQFASIVQIAARECAAEIDKILHTGDRLRVAYETSDGDAPLTRLESALGDIADQSSEIKIDAHREAINEELARFMSPIADRERLLGDRAVLEAVIREARGDLPQNSVDRAIDWFRQQSAPSAEEEYGDIDVSRRTSVDGQSLDAGTPSENAGSIDVEDYALLLELFRRKTGRSALAHSGLEPYAHMLLDEAQELSEVEVRVLGQAVADDGCVTVAGDPAQQIDRGSSFRGWPGLMQALGQGRAAPVTLETSYRCTRPIVEFGHAVLGAVAAGDPPTATREGAPVSRSRLSSEMHAAIVLADALADLLEREPMAQVAIITRENETAQRYYDSLHQQLPVRLVLDGRFSFKAGIDITSVPQVKGLEFDYVVIPDATPLDYPDDPASRRILHVAATRAIHQLWILTTREWSMLVAEAAE